MGRYSKFDREKQRKKYDDILIRRKKEQAEIDQCYNDSLKFQLLNKSIAFRKSDLFGDSNYNRNMGNLLQYQNSNEITFGTLISEESISNSFVSKRKNRSIGRSKIPIYNDKTSGKYSFLVDAVINYNWKYARSADILKTSELRSPWSFINDGNDHIKTGFQKITLPHYAKIYMLEYQHHINKNMKGKRYKQMKGSNYLKSMTRNLGITDAVNELTDQTTKDIEGMVYEKFMSKIVISGVTGYIGDDQMAQFILKHFEKYINPRHVLNEVGQYSFGYSNKHGEKSLTYCTGIFHIHSKKYGHHLVKYKYEQIGRFDRVEYFGNSDLLLEFDVKNGVYGYQTNGFVLNIFGPNHTKIRKMILKTLVKELKGKEYSEDIFQSMRVSCLRNSSLQSFNIPKSGCINNRIVFPGKEQVEKELEKWVNSRGVYTQNHIPYKFSVLFEGAPGTGKTSWVYSLVEKYGYKLIKIELDNEMRSSDLTELTNTLGNVCENPEIEPTIILFDEIDLMIEQDKKESLRNMIRVIDAIPENTIICATTNHIENLDPAVLRSGRFDRIIHMHDFNREYAEKYCKNIGIENYKEFIDKLESGSENHTFNPARLATYATEQLATEKGIQMKLKVLEEDVE